VNLDTLKTEIEQYLEKSGLAVFYGYSRAGDDDSAVLWDCELYPDYKLFVQAAQTAGAKVMVFHHRKFAFRQVQGGLEELADCGLPQNEFRQFERRLKAMRIHDGKTCAIELSFDHEGRIFLFDLQTEWSHELSGILREIEFISSGGDEDDTPMSGYYSKN
jgi:hypothetical protein